MYKKILILFLLLTNLLFSQIKEQELEEIQIEENLLLPLKPKINFKLTRDEILNRQPEDLGDLMKNIPGISLKNYGGLGGLKTISARGINGTHSGIIVDGFLIQNSQTGQIDLGNIQIDNLQEINFSFQNSNENLDVVSSYFNANNLRLITYENQFSIDTLQLRSNLKMGSFGQIDSYLSTKWNHKRYYVSLFAKYRQAKGNFPFSVQNYSETIHLKRENNDLQELYSGLSFGYSTKQNNRFKIQLLSNFSTRGLPGAVILYNPTTNQRLINKNISLNADYRFRVKKTNGRTYFSAKYDELTYLDSGYLNAQGFLKSSYFNSIFSLGTILRRNFFNGIQLSSGIEENYSFLKKTAAFNSDIQRFHFKYVFDFNYLHKNWNYSCSFGLQHIFNQEINNIANYQKFSFNPSLFIYTRKPIYFLGELRFSLRRTLRMPSFNELYYTQVGNTTLKPEIANQFSLGTFYAFNLKNNVLKLTFDGYTNIVQNKIVAVPTKNLFIWSIQNVGITRILGMDIQISYEQTFLQNLLFTTIFNYTFQNISDVSDKNSPTYKHQLAYLPKHILNANFSFQYKNFGFNINAYFNSLRYALNENISSNEVSEFYIFDFTCFFKQKIKNSNIRYSFSVKNLLNESYAYIRNYYMPGRNYLISLSYAFH